jgi:hypothetical protein
VLFALLFFPSVREFESFSTSEFPLYIVLWLVLFILVVFSALVGSTVMWKTSSYQILADKINFRARIPIWANYDFSIPLELIKYVELKTDLIA